MKDRIEDHLAAVSSICNCSNWNFKVFKIINISNLRNDLLLKQQQLLVLGHQELRNWCWFGSPFSIIFHSIRKWKNCDYFVTFLPSEISELGSKTRQLAITKILNWIFNRYLKLTVNFHHETFHRLKMKILPANLLFQWIISW